MNIEPWEITKLAAEGHTLQTIADELGLHLDALKTSLRYHEELRKAYDIGTYFHSPDKVTSKAKVWDDEMLRLLAEYAELGYPQEAIARKLCMSKITLRSHIEKDERVREAYEYGKAEEEFHLVSMLRKAADEGNVVPAMFLLKARHGYRDNQPITVNNNNVTLARPTLPLPLSAEDYKTVVDIPAEKLVFNAG